MSHPEVTFPGRAGALARNPLGIIALFICFLYSMASLTLGLATGITDGQRWLLIAFLCFFPLVVLRAYFVLVTKHASALYAPHDFDDERIFEHLIDQRERRGREPDESEPAHRVADAAGRRPADTHATEQDVEHAGETQEPGVL